MSKREARIERQNQKKLDDLERSARLIEQVKTDQLPRLAQKPASDNQPRATANPGSIMQMRMEYRIHESSDRKGSWTWGEDRNWCGPDFHSPNACTIRSTMIHISGLLWREVMEQLSGGHHKHHDQPFESLCGEAQDRWIEIGREEDTLFRFRTAGKERIWGYRQGHMFYVVWWDAKHQIYPVD